jgi:ABC-type lipoprotein release transport system permease subunit
MNYIKIAWRNLWRNKRRTAITTASILFAVFFAILMRSFQLGFYDHMIKNAIESFSGILQVQHVDYEDDPSIENTFACSDSLLQKIEHVPGVKAVVPRIESISLVSTGELTKIAMILGIDPIREKELMNPEHLLVRYRFTPEIIEQLAKNNQLPKEVKSKLDMLKNNSYTNSGSIAMDLELGENKDNSALQIISEAGQYPGSMLMPGDSGVLVSDRLSKYLKLQIGDTLVLMGQGYHGTTAAGLYPVRGIVKIANPELDNKLIYMDINTARRYLDFDNQVTSLAVNIVDNTDEGMLTAQNLITKALRDTSVTVRNWKEYNKVLVQQIQGDNQSGKAFLGLLYFIIFFGIFGTVLMMIHERYREFGVMVAIGMKKTKLAVILIYEMILMGMLGVLSGIIISFPFLYILHNNPVRFRGDLAQVMINMGFEPVMPLAWINTYVLWQGLIVAFMVVLSCLYPLRKVLKLKEIDALRA